MPVVGFAYPRHSSYDAQTLAVSLYVCTIPYAPRNPCANRVCHNLSTRCGFTVIDRLSCLSSPASEDGSERNRKRCEAWLHPTMGILLRLRDPDDLRTPALLQHQQTPLPIDHSDLTSRAKQVDHGPSCSAKRKTAVERTPVTADVSLRPQRHVQGLRQRGSRLHSGTGSGLQGLQTPTAVEGSSARWNPGHLSLSETVAEGCKSRGLLFKKGRCPCRYQWQFPVGRQNRGLGCVCVWVSFLSAILIIYHG